MGRRKTLQKAVIVSSLLVLFLLPPIAATPQPTDTDAGCIMLVKGGIIGAWAIIDTYYTGECYEFIPVRCYLTMEGDGVIFPGTKDVIVPGRVRWGVRTNFAFGFGPATIRCEVYHVDSLGMLIERVTRPAYMLGFIVFAQ